MSHLIDSGDDGDGSDDATDDVPVFPDDDRVWPVFVDGDKFDRGYGDMDEFLFTCYVCGCIVPAGESFCSRHTKAHEKKRNERPADSHGG